MPGVQAHAALHNGVALCRWYLVSIQSLLAVPLMVQEPAVPAVLSRFEVPFNIWCDQCGEHIAKGVRFNAEKKQVR